ncbi:MAG: hypothetical protein EP298_04280 [Gammaproteobacteria bacterium]|nr:MAG: hypothetical protein EP298_04280 [Gammaproteobacteria bacterium]UTW43847.1 hypothetical protein KFE69_07090 [bacterium SCSIO 12844]
MKKSNLIIDRNYQKLESLGISLGKAINKNHNIKGIIDQIICLKSDIEETVSNAVRLIQLDDRNIVVNDRAKINLLNNIMIDCFVRRENQKAFGEFISAINSCDNRSLKEDIYNKINSNQQLKKMLDTTIFGRNVVKQAPSIAYNQTQNLNSYGYDSDLDSDGDICIIN